MNKSPSTDLLLRGGTYTTLVKVIRMNYGVLSELILYNYRHIKRISTHIYKYNTSESYVKVVQKKVDSAGLHGSKSVKGKPSEGKTRKDS